MIQLRKHSIFLTALFSLALLIFGTLSAQAQSFYWRFATPAPTVSCTSSGGMFQMSFSGDFLIEYNLPNSYVIKSYDNFNGSWTDEATDSSNSVVGTGTRTIDASILGSIPFSSFPYSIGLRLETLVNGQLVYRSTLILTCPGVGSGTASLANGIIGNSASAINDGRINPENYAPVALYCDGSALTAYAIDTTGQGTFAWKFDFKSTSTDIPLVNQDGMTLSKRADGRYYVLAPQHDGKQYLFVFDGCLSPDATETYISDPATGQFVRTG